MKNEIAQNQTLNSKTELQTTRISKMIQNLQENTEFSIKTKTDQYHYARHETIAIKCLNNIIKLVNTCFR